MAQAGYTFAAFQVGICLIQIDVSYTDSLATEPNFTLLTSVAAAYAEKIFIDGLSPIGYDMDVEPLLMLAGEQDFEIRNIPLASGDKIGTTIFAAANKRISIRYKLSWDSGSNYEDIFVGEIDLQSLEIEVPYTDTTERLYKFTAYDRIKVPLELKLPSWCFGSLSSETIATLYLANNTDISSYFSGTHSVTSIYGIIDQIVQLLTGISHPTTYSIPFRLCIYNNSTSDMLRDSTMSAWLYIDAAALYAYQHSFYTPAEPGTIPLLTVKDQRVAWLQFSSAKDVLRLLCFHMGVYPYILYGGTSGTYAGTLQFVRRLPTSNGFRVAQGSRGEGACSYPARAARSSPAPGAS